MIEFFGVGIVTLVFGVAGGAFLAMKRIASKTSWSWDEEVVDTIEGLAETVEVDIEELAKKSSGRLKEKLKDKL